VTLYSGPSTEIPSESEALGGGKFRYTYRPRNLADRRSDYRFRFLEVHVAEGVKVENIVVPAGWTGERTQTAMRFTFSGPGGLAPGETATFRFDADGPPADRAPVVRWAVPGAQNGGRGVGGDLDDLIDDSEPLPLLDFNPLDFGVLGGTHHFFLDSFEGWLPVPLPAIDAPTRVPEPATAALLLAGLALVWLMRSRHRARGTQVVIKVPGDKGTGHYLRVPFRAPSVRSSRQVDFRKQTLLGVFVARRVTCDRSSP
jgi:hypothetical protein